MCLYDLNRQLSRRHLSCETKLLLKIVCVDLQLFYRWTEQIISRISKVKEMRWTLYRKYKWNLKIKSELLDFMGNLPKSTPFNRLIFLSNRSFTLIIMKKFVKKKLFSVRLPVSSLLVKPLGVNKIETENSFFWWRH